MPAPREIIEAAVAKVAAYCEGRSMDDSRIEHDVRGSSITIVERRPPWNPTCGSDWSSLKVASCATTSEPDGGGCSPPTADRWHPYELASPAPDVAPLLAAVEEDRTGLFWG